MAPVASPVEVELFISVEPFIRAEPFISVRLVGASEFFGDAGSRGSHLPINGRPEREVKSEGASGAVLKAGAEGFERERLRPGGFPRLVREIHRALGEAQGKQEAGPAKGAWPKSKLPKARGRT